ncbi:MAG: SemiSWEET family transporter [Candidatus Kapabacteria bacterium]|jgi:MtN3 and saliva related transmembrane protein|nr:SemiSWEET family transporter [Candidatus Kapabacteria bacterium]
MPFDLTATDALGIAAGCCSTFALAPQAIKVWKTQQVDQLSIGMLGLMQSGSVLWLSYGLLESDVSIIWANAVAFGFILYMLSKKIASMRR